VAESRISWEQLWILFDLVRITTVRKPEEIDHVDYERAKQGLDDFQDHLTLDEIEVAP
jgi:hypothetical protein